MSDIDNALLEWLQPRLKLPVIDESGWLRGASRVVAPRGELPEGPGSTLLRVDNTSLAGLSDRIRSELSRHREVFLLVLSDDAVSGFAELMSVIERLGATVGELVRSSGGYALSVLPSDDEGGWFRLASILAVEVDELVASHDQVQQQLAELYRSLSVAIEEQRSLVLQVDTAAERFSGLDEELLRLRVLVSERDQLDQEVQELRGKLADAEELLDELPYLRSDLERSKSELAALRLRREALEARQKRLLRDKATLQRRLETANWKLRRLRARRWWQLGRVLRDVMRRPWALRHHALGLRSLLKRTSSEPRPIAQAEPRPALSPDVPSPRDSPSESSHVVITQHLRQVNSPKDLVVASILDEMSAASFGPECHLVTLTPSGWREVLERQPPDLLLVESAWKGAGGSWEYLIGTYSHPESIGLPQLRELVRWHRERGIPTVFWNKEDPVHFEKFAEAAQLFDVVFTTDSNCVPRYRAIKNLAAHTVDVLMFAAQPRIHFPAGLEQRDRRPVFAGTFYKNRHPKRREQMEWLLDGATPFDLRIFDRMGGEESDAFGYPERFRPHIVGGVPYSEMVDVYRQSRVFLNANSVVDSPTMFSRRVFELLACGTPVVSTPSRGIEEVFGKQVAVATSVDEVEGALRRLLDSDAHWLRISGDGFSEVARRHLYEDRLRTVAEAAGYRFDDLPFVESLGSTSRIDRAEPWRDRQGNAKYYLFGSDERIAWAGRIVDARIIGRTTDPKLAYSWTTEIPDGDLAVRADLVEEGWTPSDVHLGEEKAFLIPQ